MGRFLLAMGIECSCPVVNGRRCDQPLLANFTMGSMPGGKIVSTETDHAKNKGPVLSLF